MSGADLTDLFLSFAALAGLVTLSASIRARDAGDPLNRRILFGLRVAMLLFAGRVLLTMTGWGGFAILFRIAAALIPIAVLITTEGLLRRHAPAWAKWMIGAGTPLALVAALWPSGPDIDPDDLFLMVFQIAGFLIAGWLIVTRDRLSLSSAENRTVTRLGLSLLLLLPLGVADFLGEWLGMPVRVAGLAVLALCWLAVSLGRAEAGGTAAVQGGAALVAAGLVATWIITRASGMDLDSAIMTGAVILAALLVAAVITDALSLRGEEQSLSLIRHLAEGSSGQLPFLRDLLAHPLVEGAALVEGDALHDLDPAVLGRAFAASPVLRRGGHRSLGSDEAEHVGHLFGRYAATHLMLVRVAPLRLVALSMPALATGPRAEMELAAIARMARLMEDRLMEDRDGA